MHLIEYQLCEKHGIVSVPMSLHAMKIVQQSTQFLNPGQTPVIACDHPHYAIENRFNGIGQNCMVKTNML